MGVEIERKFLIDLDYMKMFVEEKEFDSKFNIKQGYILNSKEKVVRIRITDCECYLTIKGQNTGMTRPEYEYEIPREDAENMLNTMCTDILEKTRYIWHGFGDVWEIDEFHGDNEGLIVAELEVPSENYNPTLPKWINEEVTDDPRYYNNNLIKKPYKDWL